MSPLCCVPFVSALASGPPEASPREDPRAPDPAATVAPVAVPDPEAGKAATPDVDTAPPMPEVEDIPAKPEVEESSPDDGKRRGLFDLDSLRQRGPAGKDGGSFFDPGKLEDTGPGGGMIQIRGFLSGNFFVTQRTNTSARDADGNFERVDPLPFFGGGAATLYVGAPIYADVVYARIALEYLSIPRVTAGTEDILAPAFRDVLIESAALEVNPFAWAKKSGRWFRDGFKITGGVFLIPFGIEDADHAAPINWFVSRPRVMTYGRVYPGSWTDIGFYVTWKPTFRESHPVRPIEIDIGMINGDACTQTRFADSLYRPIAGLAPPPCERALRPDELGSTFVPGDPRADVGFLGVGPDNNANKSVVARLKLFALPSLGFGGSFVWGKHPRSLTADDRQQGLTTVDVEQSPTWRAGAHLDIDFDQIAASRFPLPAVRGEFVYGVDEAFVPVDPSEATLTDRTALGGYIQVAQPLFRRKRSRLPGLIVQYRYDHADPDLDVPGMIGGVPVLVDFSDPYRYDEAIAAHSIGLRMHVVPRFTLKGDYTIQREEGGRQNHLYNDLFALQAVVDF